MKLFQQVQDFRADGDARAWALEIASWECRTELRRRSRNLATAATDGQTAANGEAPDAALEREQLASALRDSVGQLSDKDQAVINAVLAETFPANAGPASRKRKERALTRLGRVWRSMYGQ